MSRDNISHNSELTVTEKKKKTYRKPEILSVEMLEVVAATCDGSKAVFTGLDDCGTISPLNS